MTSRYHSPLHCEFRVTIVLFLCRVSQRSTLLEKYLANSTSIGLLQISSARGEAQNHVGVEPQLVEPSANFGFIITDAGVAHGILAPAAWSGSVDLTGPACHFHGPRIEYVDVQNASSAIQTDGFQRDVILDRDDRNAELRAGLVQSPR